MYGNVPFSLTMTMTMNIMQRMANKPAAAMAEIDSTNSRRVHRLFIIMYAAHTSVSNKAKSKCPYNSYRPVF